MIGMSKLNKAFIT